MSRQARKISDKSELEMFYNIQESDISTSFIFNLFGDFDGKSKFKPYDLIDIPPNIYGPDGKKNKNTFTTTLGIWIFNKWFIEKSLFHIFKYINKTITGKVFDDMNQELSYARMEDRISMESFKEYLNKTQMLMPLITILSANQSEKILTCTKAIEKKKKELISKYKKELEAGDVKVINDVEQELLKFALDYVGDDPGMDSFISGARSNINNHFKNLYVMKGAVRNPDPDAKQEYNVAFSNYTDGIDPQEYVLYCNSAAFGPYSRGKKTEFGGYMENLFMAYHDIKLDEKGTDCGTKRFREVYLDESNIKLHMYNYIIDNNELVELTSTNMNKYIGKSVKMRFADLCKNEHICNKCAGEFFYRLGLKNVGACMMQIPSQFKNKAMKAFHDSTISTSEMDPMKAFGYN